MTLELTGSLIAASTACFVALISVVAARRNAAALESFKTELAAREAARALLEAEFRIGAEHLDKLVASIQVLKDEMLVGRDALEARPADAGPLQASLHSSMRGLTAAYADAVAHLTDEEKSTAHEAKSVAVKVQHLAAAMARKRSDSDVDAVALLQAFDSLRIELTTLQMTLRDARTRRFIGNVALRQI